MITKLKIDNFKGIQAFEMDFDGKDFVVLRGKNGAGKSSVLDGIMWLFQGAKGAPDKIIHGAAESACVVVEWGPYRFTRKKGKNESIKIERLDDSSVLAKPQSFIDSMIGNLSFDPLAFHTMAPKARLEMLKSLVGINFTALDLERKQSYDMRTSINRDASTLEAQIKAFPVFPDDLPAEALQLKTLLEEQGIARENQSKKDALKKEINFLREDWHQAKNKIKDLENQILSLQNTQEETARKEKEAVYKYENTPDIPEAPIVARMEALQGINEQIRKRDECNYKWNQLEALQIASKNHTQHINEIDRIKTTQLEKAQWPIPGLSFGDGDVELGGIPCSQLSSSERIRLGVAIAQVLNPKLKIIQIRDGSLLDQESKEEIVRQCRENKYQIWLEEVDLGQSGDCIMIVDGHAE